MRVGPYLVGLRAAGPSLDAALRRAFAGLLVEPHPSVNLSLHVATTAKSFHVLSWGGCPVVRTLDVDRLLTALLRFVGSHAAQPIETLRTDFMAVVRDGTAVMIARSYRTELVKRESHLRKGGLSILEAPWVDVDLHAGALIVTDPALPIDPAGWAELRALAPTPLSRDLATAPGRYRVTGVVVDGTGESTPLPHSRAAYEVAQRLVGGPGGRQNAVVLTGLASFAERVPVFSGGETSETAKLAVRLSCGG